jgi:hypothetical protein
MIKLVTLLLTLSTACGKSNQSSVSEITDPDPGVTNGRYQPPSPDAFRPGCGPVFLGTGLELLNKSDPINQVGAAKARDLNGSNGGDVTHANNSSILARIYGIDLKYAGKLLDKGTKYRILTCYKTRFALNLKVVSRLSGEGDEIKIFAPYLPEVTPNGADDATFIKSIDTYFKGIPVDF